MKSNNNLFDDFGKLGLENLECNKKLLSTLYRHLSFFNSFPGSKNLEEIDEELAAIYAGMLALSKIIQEQETNELINLGHAKPGDPDEDDEDPEDPKENEDEEEKEEDERITSKNFPPLSSVRSDFQLMEYKSFNSYFSDIFSIYNSFEKEASFEDFLPHIMQEAALYVPTPDENEKDFIKNTRDLCKLSYIEHLFSDILFRQVEMYEVQVEHIIMGKEYFLFLANLFEKHYQRTGNIEYEDYFRTGEIFETPIIISKYASVPFATYVFKDDPHKNNKKCHLPTKREVIRKFPDIFDENGNLKEKIVWAEDLLDQLASSW